MAVLLASCNQFYGIEETGVPPDADLTSQCAPLSYDARRYASLVGPFDWQSTRDACQQLHGMDVVVFDEGDSEELTAQQNAASLPYWLGLSHGASGWETVDTCRPAQVPANGQGNECAVQDGSGPATAGCIDTQYMGANISGLCETPRPSRQCRATADQRDYLVITGPDVTRSDADTMCAANGMHVVEINSSAELDAVLVAASAVPSFWIDARTNFLTWSNSTSCPQIFSWKADEPMLAGGLMCVRYFGGMETVTCTNTANVVCERNQ